MTIAQTIAAATKDYKTDPLTRIGVWATVATVVLFVGSLVGACLGV